MKNQLDLTPNIVSIDIETSGLDKNKARIIQIGGVKYTNKWKKLSEFNHYILPKEPWEMEPDAEAVHGISKEFILKNGIPLEDIYDEWIEFLGDCDIITYNGNAFDIPFLYAEFQRAGLDPKIIEHRLIDVYKIEKEVNANTLVATYTRYTGKEAIDAHDANADSKMTIRVLYEQMNRFNVEEILKPEDMKMDFPESILALNEDGKIILTGGKHKDKMIFEVCKKDPSYIKWLFANVLCKSSKDKVMKEYNSLK